MPNSVWQTPYGRLSMADFVWSKLRMTQLRMVCHTESAILSWAYEVGHTKLGESAIRSPYGRLRMADFVWSKLRMPNSVCPTQYGRLSMADSV